GFGAAAFARSPRESRAGLPSRSSRTEPAFALWASARQPSLVRHERAGLACRAVAREASEGWWGRKDSNLRSHEAADLQSAPFATRDTSPSVSVRNRPPEWRRAGPWMTLRPKARLEPASTGAFMGEAGWQSQPTEPVKNALDEAKLPYSVPRDTSSP